MINLFMTFLFKRKQIEQINPFLLEDIENKIIEIDSLEPEIHYFNEHDEPDFKHFNDVLVKGMNIMAACFLCICIGFLYILYPLI